MESGATREARRERALAAILSAAIGLGVGALVYAATGTAKGMLSPGLEVDSPEGWVLGPVLLFEEGLLFGLVGGALVLLPPAFLAFLALARRARPDGTGPHATLAAALGAWAALFAPLYVFGLRGRVLDGLLLGLSIWVGVRHGLRDLARRLAPR